MSGCNHKDVCWGLSMKRVVIVGISAAFGLVAAAGAEARVLSAPPIPAGVVAKATQGEKVACGSRGGPGYRKSNGKCASWRR